MNKSFSLKNKGIMPNILFSMQQYLANRLYLESTQIWPFSSLF